MAASNESNRIKNVAIVGASGYSGSFMTEALLESGQHTITAITRVDSQSKLPAGVISKQVDYGKPETLVKALRGQDALVITLSIKAPEGTEMQLINAAHEAGVAWILPNEWSGPDTANEDILRDVSLLQSKVATRRAIENLDKLSYIAMCTGFWYEWSLAIPEGYGIDLKNRTCTLYDEGKTKISMSTWAQVGRSVAALLSLPIKPGGSNKEACLESLRNKVVYTNSFTVNQTEMLDSIFRVTGTKAEDWTISKEPARERYANGIKDFEQGQFVGLAKMMYARVFYDDGNGDFEHSKGTLNSILGLPKEDIDEATKAAIEHSKTFKMDWLL